MSMYYSANKIFGLLLTGDEIENFQRAYCLKNKDYLICMSMKKTKSKISQHFSSTQIKQKECAFVRLQ